MSDISMPHCPDCQRVEYDCICHGGQEFIGHVTGYCRNQSCMVREVDIAIKNHDGDPLPVAHCPVCLRCLSHVKAVSLAELILANEKSARQSVNVQKYRRDHCRPGELACVPMSVYADDRL